jgi:hypothetical protein
VTRAPAGPDGQRGNSYTPVQAIVERRTSRRTKAEPLRGVATRGATGVIAPGNFVRFCHSLNDLFAIGPHLYPIEGSPPMRKAKSATVLGDQIAVILDEIDDDAD